MLTFTLYGICRLIQVLIVIALRWGAGLPASGVLLASSLTALVCMIVTVILFRRQLSACLRNMFDP